MATEPQDRPSTPRPEYIAAAPDISLIRDLLGGTRVMHAKYKDYIPKYKAEKPESYKRRATAAKVFGGLGRTLSASVGMLFAKPPERADRWTESLSQMAENIDAKGAKLEVFAKRRSEDAIADGYVGILVDFPNVEGKIEHSGDELALNARPRFTGYQRADILSWRTAVIDNVETLVQVVLREGASRNVGKFQVEHVTLYRVCHLTLMRDAAHPESEPAWMAWWELLEERKQADGTVVIVQIAAGTFRDKSGTAFDEIPLAVAYAGRTDAPFCARPPLLDVAWANLEHWRVATNLRHYEDECCFPQPTIEGELARGPNGEERPLLRGPGVLAHVTAGSKYTVTELQGTSLDQLRQSLAEKKQEIAELGMSFLNRETRAAETAEAKRLDATAENSTLATAAQGIEDGHNEALRFFAKYMGIEAEQAPVLTFNREFEEQVMDPATMGAYSAFVGQGMPKDAVVQVLIDGGRLPEDTDVEDFVARWEAAEEAARDLAAMEAEQDAERMQKKPRAA